MKGKIGTILLIVVLMVLVAACSILGVKYLDNRNELKELKEASQTTQTEEQKAPESKTKSELVESTKYALPKFDASKVDNSKRENMAGFEEGGEEVIVSNDFRYVKGPRKIIYSNTMPEELDYSILYANEKYVLDSNIVDVKTIQHNVSSEFYIIALAENGKIYYGLTNTQISKIDFKEYTELSDVVRLVRVGGNTRGTAIGAITLDGVTHLLPYDMP